MQLHDGSGDRSGWFADRDGIAVGLRAISGPDGETILPGEFAKAKEILAGGSINYDGGSGPQDFDGNGDVAGFFSANVVVPKGSETKLTIGSKSYDPEYVVKTLLN